MSERPLWVWAHWSSTARAPRALQVKNISKWTLTPEEQKLLLVSGWGRCRVRTRRALGAAACRVAGLGCAAP